VPLLSSIRVLDLSAVGPASRATGILADYGAEVVKVLRPQARIGDSFEAPASSYGAGRGVRRLRLDLAEPDGRDVLLRLADGADVVIESFRPGVADRLGVGPRTVRARNPRLVYCSVSGYGRSGPYAGWAAHDLNYLGVTGLLAHGERLDDGRPAVPGATIADAAGGGMHAVIAILAALLARERSGQGADLDVSVTEGSLWLMSLVVDEFLSAGLDDSAVGLLSGEYACYSTYRTADGRWLTVAALERRFWRNLCEALGLAELVAWHRDPTRQPELKRRLAAAFATRDRESWLAVLAPGDTCVAPVHEIADLVADPQFRARGVFERVATGDGVATRTAPLLAGQARHGLHGAGGPGTAEGPDVTRTPEHEGAAPDVDDLLAAAGFAPHEVAALRARGVVT
jgi:alpha-methylacyl-CoA racemase